MNEQDQKLLTEKMGECWHEPDSECALGREYNGGGMIKQKCLKCGCLLSTTYQIYADNRTFTTPDDLFAVYSKMVEKGDWEEFDSYAIETLMRISDHLFNTAELNAWLFCLGCPEQIPARLKLVVEFGKEKLGW